MERELQLFLAATNLTWSMTLTAPAVGLRQQHGTRAAIYSSPNSKFICELQITDLEFSFCGHHQTFVFISGTSHCRYQNTAAALGEIPALGGRF